MLRLAYRTVSDLIFPRHCLGCGVPLLSSSKEPTCITCDSAFAIDERKRCIRCAASVGEYAKNANCPDCRNQTLHFRKAHTAFEYIDVIRYAIHAMKFSERFYIAKFLAKQLAKSLRQNKDYLSAELIIPVPLSWQREWSRGFNQSELLANTLAEELNIKTDAKILKRIRNTQAQSFLEKRERQKNLTGAFKVKHLSKVKGKTIILIDDVMTTGSTLKECSKTLIDAGAKKVFVAVIARV